MITRQTFSKFRLALFLTMVLGVFAGAPHASAAPGGFTACLAFEITPAGGECRVIANTVGIMIGVENGDAVISYLDPATEGFTVQYKESVSLDLQNQVQNSMMSDDQAAFIFAELLSSHDLLYRVPESADVLKRAVGFPPQAMLSPEDHVEVLRSHLQINLGVGAETADYLVEKLGVQVIEAPAPEAPAPEAPTAELESVPEPQAQPSL